MKDAGVDVTQFKPHSTRAASTSKAKAAAVPIQEILKTAGWSSSRCFDRCYNKPVQTNNFLKLSSQLSNVTKVLDIVWMRTLNMTRSF